MSDPESYFKYTEKWFAKKEHNFISGNDRFAKEKYNSADKEGQSDKKAGAIYCYAQVSRFYGIKPEVGQFLYN